MTYSPNWLANELLSTVRAEVKQLDEGNELRTAFTALDEMLTNACPQPSDWQRVYCPVGDRVTGVDKDGACRICQDFHPVG